MRKHHRQLDASVGASGPHDFAVRIRAARLATQTRPPQPVPTSVTWPTPPLAGQAAVDAFVSQDVRHGCVRRSRVVLTPRRWRQVGDDACASRWRWWQESPVTRESTYKSSNHCAGKAGVFPLNLYARVRISLCINAHETAGAARTRSSLRPLLRVACALS